MSDDAGASGAQRGDEEKGLMDQGSEASSDGAGATTKDGSADSAFVVLKKRSEKSLERFIITFAVVNPILAVRVQQPVVRVSAVPF